MWVNLRRASESGSDVPNDCVSISRAVCLEGVECPLGRRGGRPQGRPLRPRLCAQAQIPILGDCCLCQAR